MASLSLTINTGLQRFSDILVAGGVLLILVIMVIPIPTPVLDFLIALNIAMALAVLMVAMYMTEPLQFSVFPGLLLILTLFRLSLNIASTRLILGEGFAGSIISSFGNFVVKGNYVVGFIIFLILVIIQFVVITKGAGRIAEVAARFTLDAMPGKQMAIDADLNAGLIDEAEARKRREDISREADFYGAMDGASKFVRGDAIAGLIITFINVIGGLIIGVGQKGMGFAEAAQTYTLLTVGDGLVSQIPALIVSTSAGIIVARAASNSHLGQDLINQLLFEPRGLYIISGVLAFFAITPGLPMMPFLTLSVLAFITARSARSAIDKENAEEVQSEKEKEAEPEPIDEVEKYLHVDPLELEIGYGLIPLVDPEHGGDLLHRITMIRKQVALELGIIIPPIRIRDNIQLKPDDYVVKLRGHEIARGEVRMGYFMALNPGIVSKTIRGIETVEPAFGLPALWIPESRRTEAAAAGYTVIEPAAVLATHLKELLKRHAHELLGRQETQKLIDHVKKDYPAVVEEVIPNQLSLGTVQKILQNLLKERVSIRDLVRILEILGDSLQFSKDPDVLTEYVRNGLGPTIHEPYLSEDGAIYAITLDPALERRISESVRSGDSVLKIPNLPPNMLKEIYEQVKALSDKLMDEGKPAVMVVSPGVRLYTRRLVETVFPDLAVLAITEIPTHIEIKSIGTIRVSHED
ncbi:MAG: flagellar biosynthesis protein FlhA [candidate division KSB1 bacterium]|nr:flagellar biosynthesis protein FlhA [candidate division KSB1 bacterium]